MGKDDHYLVKRELRTFEQVAQQILKYIKNEKLSAGNKIPPERKLSELLQVSRSSVREGVRVLELLQYVESRQGGGTYVSESPPYLIPAHSLNDSLDKGALASHFGVFLMCSEKIVRSAMKHNAMNPAEEPADFVQWIKQLKSYTENQYFLSLWDRTFDLLDASHFFSSYPLNDKLEELQIAFYNKNLLKVIEWFEKVAVN